MIDTLKIDNLALIREATLECAPGLTVITGETGAGKTALLNGLKLLVGERASADMVRFASDGAVISGRFFTDALDMEGVVVRRRVSPDGRSRVSIDGQLASVTELSERMGRRVEICGQHDHQRLLNKRHHQDIIDNLDEQVIDAACTYRRAFEAYRQAQCELQTFYELRSSDEAQANQARYLLEQLDAVKPEAGEVEKLEAMLPRAEHASALAHAARESYAALMEEGAAEDLIRTALDLLHRQTNHDQSLEPLCTQLTEALETVADVGSELRVYQENLWFDEDELDRLSARYDALSQLYKRFGPTHDHLMKEQERATEILDALDASPEQETQLIAKVDDAKRILVQAACDLHRARVSAARTLCAQVNEALNDLDMASAEISVAVDELSFEKYQATSPDVVELLYRPSSHMGFSPLTRIASGGEISRVMLAIKAVLGAVDSTDTLIFDEVDAGVGGHAARQVARMIARLATTHQVICVTHLPQIAVMGQRHYVMDKETDQSGAVTSFITEVAGEDRIDELARMLSGEVTESAQEHARALLVESACYRSAMPGGDGGA